jgi:hypothetical protein
MFKWSLITRALVFILIWSRLQQRKRLSHLKITLFYLFYSPRFYFMVILQHYTWDRVWRCFIMSHSAAYSALLLINLSKNYGIQACNCINHFGILPWGLQLHFLRWFYAEQGFCYTLRHASSCINTNLNEFLTLCYCILSCSHHHHKDVNGNRHTYIRC